MTNYYVAASGGIDINPGTEEEPWATWQHAADTATGGDTVYFLDGTHDGGGGDDFDANSGSAGSPIAFRAQNPHQAIIQYDGTAATKLDINGRSYLLFADLVIDGGQASATTMIRLQGTCGNITFDNLVVRETRGHAFRLLSGGTFTDITIQYCEINPNSTPDSARNGINVQASASRINILYNTIYGTDHNGISIDCDDGLVEHNTVYATESHGIQVNGGNGIVVRYNDLHGEDGWGDDATNPTGMAYGVYVQGDGTDIKNLDVYWNNIWNTSNNGIYLYGPTVVGPIHVWNNTMWDNNQYFTTNGAFRIAGVTASPHPVIQVYNNIFHTEANRCMKFEDVNLDNTDVDYNLFYASASGGQEIQYDNDPNTPFATFQAWQDDNAQLWDQNSVIQQNPLFIDKANGNFFLLIGSPAIDAGTDVGLDYHGDFPDIGAEETNYVARTETSAAWTAKKKAATAGTTAWAALVETRTVTVSAWTATRKAEAGTFSAWSNKTKTATGTTAVWAALGQTKTVAVDAWAALSRTRTGPVTAWSTTKKTGTETPVAWAVLERTGTETAMAWAVTGAARTGQATVWVVLEKTETGTATAWAVVKRARTETATAWAILERTETGTVTAWTVTGAARTGQATAWAVLEKTGTEISTAWGILNLARIGMSVAFCALLESRAGHVVSHAVVRKTGTGSAVAWIVLLRNPVPKRISLLGEVNGVDGLLGEKNLVVEMGGYGE